MILWVAERTQGCGLLDSVVVATDDKRIFDCVKSAGLEVVMTARSHPSGTDRIFEAAQHLGAKDEDIICNIQGDEPMVSSQMISQLLQPWENQRDCAMTSLGHILSTEDLSSLNAVKVLCDSRGKAIYFSRLPIPFSRQLPSEGPFSSDVLKHMGFYSYRMSALRQFCTALPSVAEQAESLEQLRALHLGMSIYISVSSEKSCSIDSASDLQLLEKIWRP